MSKGKTSKTYFIFAAINGSALSVAFKNKYTCALLAHIHTFSRSELADLTSIKTAPEMWILRDVTLTHTQNNKRKRNKRDRWTSRWGKTENWQEPQSWGTSVHGDPLHGQCHWAPRGHSRMLTTALQRWLQGLHAREILQELFFNASFQRLHLHKHDHVSTVRGCLSCGPYTRCVWPKKPCLL